MTKNRIFSGLFCVLLILMQCTALTCYADTVNETIIDGILQYQLNSTGNSSVQDWINSDITSNAGVSSEFYVIALKQSGQAYDFSSYADSLESYVSADKYSGAVAKEKYALSLLAAGRNTAYVNEVMNSSIGAQGIMSYIYGLHLLNTGCTSANYTARSVCDTLVSMQCADGGWTLFGDYSDTDVTAMTLQALSFFSGTDVQGTIDEGIQRLSELQLEDGGYSSMGAENPESIAQVITALSALGIDCMTDERFQKNGLTVFDALEQFRLSDGSYCHSLDGGSNQLATQQVFYSMIAYRRFEQGMGSLYDIELPQITAPSETEIVTQAVNNETVTSVKTTATASKKETSASDSKTTETTSEITASSTAKSSETSTKTTTSVQTESTEKITEQTVKQSEKSSKNKIIGTVIVIGLGGAMCLLLVLLKKTHRKNFIAVILVTVLGITAIWTIDIHTPDDYYKSTDKENITGYVTFTIRCDTIIGKSDEDYIPEDAVILPETQYPISDGDTVFDILNEAVQQNSIQMEFRGTDEMAYISGINYIYELQYGDLSGWMYLVNGKAPSVNCGAYELSDGDSVEWLYTCDIGHDIGAGDYK